MQIYSVSEYFYEQVYSLTIHWYVDGDSDTNKKNIINKKSKQTKNKGGSRIASVASFSGDYFVRNT